MFAIIHKLFSRSQVSPGITGQITATQKENVHRKLLTNMKGVATKNPVSEGDGHSVTDQHLRGRHHGQVGDVHLPEEIIWFGSC